MVEWRDGGGRLASREVAGQEDGNERVRGEASPVKDACTSLLATRGCILGMKRDDCQPNAVELVRYK